MDELIFDDALSQIMNLRAYTFGSTDPEEMICKVQEAISIPATLEEIEEGLVRVGWSV